MGSAMTSQPLSSISLSSSASSTPVIDLCSHNPNLANNAESPNASGCCHIDSNDKAVDQVDSELKLVGEICKQSNTLEQKMQNRKVLKELDPNTVLDGRVNQQPLILQQQSCRGDVWLPLTPLPSPSTPLSLSVLTSIPTETEGKGELKRKLEIVTAELSRSRMEQVKRLKRTTVREQTTVEVLDFPIEYYNQIPAAIKYHNGEPQYWFQLFNRSLHFNNMPPEYSAWVKARTTEFLPEVLKIITTVWNNNAPTASKFSGSDLLKCRLVSKSWKRSVDKLIQKPCLDGGLPMVSTELRSSDYIKLHNFSLSLSKSPDALKPHPFPSRSLIVSASSAHQSENTKLFNGAIQVLVDVYGNAIQHFGYHGNNDICHNFFRGTTPLRTNSWVTLRGWLAKMQNLKTLHIYLPPYVSDQQVNQENITLVSRNPFPRFPKLVVLECRHVPNFLMKSILSHNKTIEKLNCFQLSNSGEAQLNWIGPGDQLCKLSEFSTNDLKMSDILSLGQANWPLRKLTLTTRPIHQAGIELGVVFTALKSFQNTLQELTLRLRNTCSREIVPLELPHIKKLDILLIKKSKDENISYDVLLPLNQLETLRLVFERETDKTGEVVQVIQLQGYLNRLYESNIWKLFPCLKKVEAIVFYEDGSSREFQYCRHELPQ